MTPKVKTGKWMTEKDVVQQLGITLSLLKVWKRKGLLTPNRSGEGGHDLYDGRDIQRIKEAAKALSRLRIPDPVNAVVNQRIPVRWMTQLLGVSRQRIYQIRPGSLTIENALYILERKAKSKPEIQRAFKVIRDLKGSGLL
ncbi:MAG: helix-turn-helix domain-containing protein [Armatimonadetes bacterium]|nr:helix-turn-helix domain-containing protein [Armatimonadota bacterium]MDW8122146.1 MerR family transcriptional regulator [Armatimonadota bacterium]